MPNFFVPAWRWQLPQARLLPAYRLARSATSGPIWAYVAVMRSRPRRTRRPFASFGSAPISGTVQIAAPASCATLVVTAGPTGHPNSNNNTSAATPAATHERMQASSIQPASRPRLSSCEGQAPAFYHGRPSAFVHELFLSAGEFSARLAGKQGQHGSARRDSGV